MKTMMRCLVMVIFVGTISTKVMAQWVQAGLPNRQITTFAKSGIYLFAGSDSGVYRSTDNGTSWFAANTGFTSKDISCFVVSGTNIIAGTGFGNGETINYADDVGGGGIFISTNFGTIWTAINNGLPKDVNNPTMFSSITSLLVYGGKLYTGTNGGGLYLSVDNGTSWTAVNVDTAYRYVKELFVSGPNLFIMAQSKSQFISRVVSRAYFCSKDSGYTWSKKSDFRGYPFTVDGSNIYATEFQSSDMGGGSGNTFRSTDHGDHWTITGTNSPCVNCLTITKKDDGGTILFGGHEKGARVSISANHGMTWIDVSTGLNTNSFWVCSLKIIDTYLFAATDSGVWRRPLSDFSQLMGTYTVGKTGYFPSLDSAFARLSRDGILGPVTLTLIDTLYDATTNANGSFTLVGPIAGAGAASRITIRPADNVAVTIRGNGDATLLFEDISYCTIDGVSLTGNTRLNVHALYNTNYAYNEGLLFTANSDFNIIMNITAGTDDNTKMSGAIGLWGKSTGSPDKCLITNVQVTSGGMGIYIVGSSSVKSMGNVIRNNYVGSTNDSLIALGIQNQYAEGTVIEKNHVQNLRSTVLSVLNSQCGINSYGSKSTIIRNNIIHNLRIKESDSRISGIIVSGGTSNRGSNEWIYNNKVWDISNTGETNAELDGITAWYQDSLKIDYNSVFLSEMSDTPPTVGSSAIYFPSTNTTPIIRNNILVNTRNDSPYVSVAIRMDAATSFSDHNDLFVGTSSSANIAKKNTTLYKTLADWKGVGKDLHSVSMSPLFCTQALHIDTTNSTSNSLDGKGTPITGILYDFEGQLRHTTTPDIGADEFIKVVGPDNVEKNDLLPETFSLSQNYPNPFNPTTVISYQLPVNSMVSLKIYDLLGREIATLVNEEQSAGWKEVEWNATNVGSGIYFYKLTAGNYVGVKKLMLLK